jgi:hypothetical protein
VRVANELAVIVPSRPRSVGPRRHRQGRRQVIAAGDGADHDAAAAGQAPWWTGYPAGFVAGYTRNVVSGEMARRAWWISSARAP